MRGDMGGAATVVASTLAIAKLKLPVNLIAVTPLTENMPGVCQNLNFNSINLIPLLA